MFSLNDEFLTGISQVNLYSNHVQGEILNHIRVFLILLVDVVSAACSLACFPCYLNRPVYLLSFFTHYFSLGFSFYTIKFISFHNAAQCTDLVFLAIQFIAHPPNPPSFLSRHNNGFYSSSPVSYQYYCKMGLHKISYLYNSFCYLYELFYLFLRRIVVLLTNSYMYTL